MGRFYVIRTGRTTWEEQARVECAAGAPLTRQATEELRQFAKELPSNSIRGVYAGTDQAEQQTADLLAGPLGLKVHTQEQLRCVDYGMWQGLTVDEIKRRQPKVYRQWISTPHSVRPPGGETLDEATERLHAAFKQIRKRNKKADVLVVLRPAMLALLRHMIEDRQIDSLQMLTSPAEAQGAYEVDAAAI